MNIFQTDIFLQAFSKVRGDKPILGHGMWMHEGRFFKHAFCSPWNGFADINNLDELIKVASEENGIMVRFTSRKLVNDARLDLLPPYPTIITLPTFSPEKKVRWAARKAEEEGVTVEKTKTQDVYFLFEKVLQRGERLIPLEFYDILERANVGYSLTSKYEDKFIAALYYVVDENKVHYLYSIGTDTEFAKTQGSMLLMIKFLEESFSRGAPFVDLCGCSVERIYQFKKQFGTRVVFRPNYILPINKIKWKVVKKFAKELYAPLPTHVPERNNWKNNLVPE